MPVRRSRLFAPLLAALLGAAAAGPALAQDEALATLREATAVFEDMRDMQEQQIPPAMLEGAEAVAIVPGVVKAGVLVGGRRGRGVLLTRKGDSTWSAPAFLTLTGGSFGFQAGASSTDVVLIFRNESSVQSLADGKITLGGTVGVAAGPVGRNAEAATDGRLRAEIYSYSRSRGAFAGASLEGTSLRFDADRTRAVYGADTQVYDLLFGETPPPAAAARLHGLLAQTTP